MNATDKQTTVNLKRDGKAVPVLRSDYVTAKTKQLVEFGYDTLTEDEVSKELDALLAGNKLTIIGRMMEGDLEP